MHPEKHYKNQPYTLLVFPLLGRSNLTISIACIVLHHSSHAVKHALRPRTPAAGSDRIPRPLLSPSKFLRKNKTQSHGHRRDEAEKEVLAAGRSHVHGTTPPPAEGAADPKACSRLPEALTLAAAIAAARVSETETRHTRAAGPRPGLPAARGRQLRAPKRVCARPRGLLPRARARPPTAFPCSPLDFPISWVSDSLGFLSVDLWVFFGCRRLVIRGRALLLCGWEDLADESSRSRL